MILTRESCSWSEEPAVVPPNGLFRSLQTRFACAHVIFVQPFCFRCSVWQYCVNAVQTCFWRQLELRFWDGLSVGSNCGICTQNQILNLHICQCAIVCLNSSLICTVYSDVQAIKCLEWRLGLLYSSTDWLKLVILLIWTVELSPPPRRLRDRWRLPVCFFDSKINQKCY